MLDKARSQSKHMDESNAAASLLSMETTANNHHYLHNKTSRATLMNSSQDGKKDAEDEVSDGANSRHPTISSTSIESLKTTYDENPLLSIMKSTCAPNNTPVHTPSGSPSLKVQSGGDIKDDPKENDTITTTNTTLQDRRDSDNAVHAAASPLAPSNTPSDPKSLCNGHVAQATDPQISGAIQPQYTATNEDIFPYSSTSTNSNTATTTIVAGAKKKIHLPPPQAPAVSSPGTTAAGSGAGTGSGIRSRTGSDLPLIITSANKNNGKNTNSPMSILSRNNSTNNNDNNSIQSSDSRESSNNNEIGGYLRGGTKRGGSPSNDSPVQHNVHDDQCAVGVAPRNFYFNKDREITDPNVKLDENESKVNISFWLNSKYRDEAYSLNESSSNNASSNTDTPTNSRHANTSSSITSRNNFQHFRFNQIPSQPPTSASSFTSTNNNNPQRNNINRGEDPFATSSRPSTGFFYGDLPNRNNRNSPFHTNEQYIPPPPPKYINSKLDGLRSRLLLGPNSASSSTKLDDDLGTAAAVLSNMRSSPYRTHDKPISNVNDMNNTNALGVPASRPHSSSFPSKGVLRPILLRIHNSEQQPTFESNNSTAVFDEDQDQNQDLSPYHLNLNSKKVLDPTFESRTRQVTWNKNGKRIDRRLSAPEQQQQLEVPPLKKSRRSVGNARVASQTNSDYNSLGESSTSSAPSSPSLKASSGLAYTADYPNATSPDFAKSKGKNVKPKAKSKAKQSSKKRPNNTTSKSKANNSQESNNATSSTSQGTRSRTGCWICRLRKKKCTEERPHCFNCERLKLDCHYDAFKPDFVSDPKKKQMKLEEIKKKTKEAKRRAMKKK
ncbi:AIG_G0010750.mRNA.1.CDS.1 [Saccharomyces cerevisiae]|nr:AIG_G0010750.mRNA.1.CDS.1 [Saccharomyces cerevisiae]CAI6566485.1 AIG_G0010750.mRNA.1.CDS.1 [Saccharomyces cerevisiae]